MEKKKGEMMERIQKNEETVNGMRKYMNVPVCSIFSLNIKIDRILLIYRDMFIYTI